jgi:acetyl-CoA carboxylase biotin carboxylase subunit
MFKRILIANRGEIALRIIRACQELGIETVAVYSEADAESLHVRLADEAVCIGPPPASESYLNVPRIVSAAEITNSDAIHPGYGFLAENAEFAEICEASNIRFIGPTSENIRKMGDKALARMSMAEAGVPVLPGSEGVAKSVEEAEGVAEKVGYPILIKAVNGGGGKGMRIVETKENLSNSFLMCRAEAEAAFGSPEVYIEKLLLKPRHVEIQIVGDSQGTIVQLHERDCSVQRRHQKLIEESPSPAFTPTLRKKIGETAVEGARKIGYESVGTIEFLLDSELNFYFMEMNTRIQVEHTVTSGGELSFAQEDVSLNGHAIECRVNAEDPDVGFQPCPGTISYLHLPGGRGIRVDTHVYAGYTIPPHYDSLIAKIVAHGRDRAEAVEQMKRALGECLIEGVKTTIPFYQRVLSHDDFISGNVDTTFAESFPAREGPGAK